ncbi:MAG: hypothetical protein J5905_07665 [Prevotella sp.]|nr:hypothetical protein [Prevotella sp.]MBO5614356.1 hypothetical protein [Prevotella sp.]
MRKRIFLVVILAICIQSSVRAQSKLEASLKADFVSSFIWRGQNLGHVSVQPELSVGWRGLSLSAWGSVGLTNHKDDNIEIDLTLQYTTGGLSLGIIDYWNDDYDKRYFYYKKEGEGTGHSFEGYVGYDFGPVGVSWQTFFAGNDYQDADGKRAYSSYFQLTAPFRLVSCNWETAAGLVPWASDYYSVRGFSVTCLSLKATKDIRITDSFSLPLFAQIVANPASQNMYFVAGLTLNAF